MKKTLWIVGQYRWINKTKKWDKNWEIQGVFDSKVKAFKVCKTPAYFVGGVILNKPFTDKREKWYTIYPVKKWK